MKRMRVESAAHPLWVVPKGMGREGGGGNSPKETGVDESGRETADMVARYHAD